MILVVVVVAVAVVCVPLRGGRWSRVAALHLRATPCAWAAAGVQVAAFVIPGVGPLVARVLHFGSYVLILVFLTANRRLAGMGLVLVGALLNVAAIAANGGVMPASPVAVAAAGLEPGAIANSRPVADARLAFLGDIWSVPDGWPFANVFSPGDVVLAIGAVWAVQAASGAGRSRRRGAAAEPAERGVPVP